MSNKSLLTRSAETHRRTQKLEVKRDGSEKKRSAGFYVYSKSEDLRRGAAGGGEGGGRGGAVTSAENMFQICEMEEEEEEPDGGSLVAGCSL